MLQGVLLPWMASSSWTSDYLQPVLLTHKLSSTPGNLSLLHEHLNPVLKFYILPFYIAGKYNDANQEFSHIDYEGVVHKHSLQEAHVSCASPVPKIVLTPSMCRRILEEALSLLSHHLKAGYNLQVHGCFHSSCSTLDCRC